MTAPQVRRGEEDERIVKMFGNNHDVVTKLLAMLDAKGLTSKFEAERLIAWCRRHSDVWKDAAGNRERKLGKIEINTTDPKTRGWKSTGACACFEALKQRALAEALWISTSLPVTAVLVVCVSHSR